MQLTMVCYRQHFWFQYWLLFFTVISSSCYGCKIFQIHYITINNLFLEPKSSEVKYVNVKPCADLGSSRAPLAWPTFGDTDDEMEVKYTDFYFLSAISFLVCTTDWYLPDFSFPVHNHSWVWRWRNLSTINIISSLQLRQFCRQNGGTQQCWKVGEPYIIPTRGDAMSCPIRRVILQSRANYFWARRTMESIFHRLWQFDSLGRFSSLLPSLWANSAASVLRVWLLGSGSGWRKDFQWSPNHLQPGSRQSEVY